MIIDNTIVPSDHKCMLAGQGTSIIVTESTYDVIQTETKHLKQIWYHVTYVKCTVCNRVSNRYVGAVISHEKAINDWNSELCHYYHGRPDDSILNNE